MTQLNVRQEQGREDQRLFDVAAAEAFTKIAGWLRPMSEATSDLVVFTCVADILAQALEGQDLKVIEAVWEWVRESALPPSQSG